MALNKIYVSDDAFLLYKIEHFFDNDTGVFLVNVFKRPKFVKQLHYVFWDLIGVVQQLNGVWKILGDSSFESNHLREAIREAISLYLTNEQQVIEIQDCFYNVG